MVALAKHTMKTPRSTNTAYKKQMQRLLMKFVSIQLSMKRTSLYLARNSGDFPRTRTTT